VKTAARQATTRRRKPPARIRFGTVGSPLSTPKKPGGSPGGIRRLRELGLGALELAWVQSVRVTDDTCALIAAAGREQDVALSIHAPYYINLNAQTAELLEASRGRLLAATRAGAKAGATDIIFHPASYHGQPPEQVYERVKGQLVELTQLLRAEGVQVKLRPELTGKGAMFGTLEEIVELSAEVPGVRPCIDFAHLHARTNGAYNTYDEFVAALRLVRKRLGPAGLRDLHVHLSGITYTPKGERSHLKLAEADLDLKAFCQALVDEGARGRVLCESPAMEDDALVMQSTYQKCAG
jgi:deoxyribonuclease-4